jgi:hypothetical protein
MNSWISAATSASEWDWHGNPRNSGGSGVGGKPWVVHLACSKPKDLGCAAELWTRSALAGHVRREAVGAGFPALKNAGKATVQRILAAQELQPHKVRYYLERRDPDFDSRMRDVLLVYREVAMENEAADRSGETPGVITVSVDEKPGVKAIANTAPDLPPVPGKYPTFARDHECVSAWHAVDSGGP